MKRVISLFLTLLLALAMLSVGVLAAEESRSYDFDLSVGGSHEITARTGDVLTVTLTLRRTDAAQSAEMYAMQDEIRYDDEFFEVVDGGALTASGVQTTDIALMGGDRAFYVNFASMTGGETWQPETLVATFQIRVLATSGTSTLKNENGLVSLKDGSGSYTATVRDLTVTVSDTCSVRLDPGNGEEPTTVSVKLGEKLEKPQDPTREGYTFTGWYRDADRTQLWDFENDTVTENMTLYAGWSQVTQPTQPSTPEPPIPTGDSVQPWMLLLPLLALAAIVVLVILLRRERKTK